MREWWNQGSLGIPGARTQLVPSILPRQAWQQLALARPCAGCRSHAPG